jgi:hypothetical protein
MSSACNPANRSPAVASDRGHYFVLTPVSTRPGSLETTA